MTFHKLLDDGPIRSDIIIKMWKKLHYESRQLVLVRGMDMVCHLDFTLPGYTTKPH